MNGEPQGQQQAVDDEVDQETEQQGQQQAVDTDDIAEADSTTWSCRYECRTTRTTTSC